MSLSTEYVVSSLQGLYGESVTSGDVRAWCAMNGLGYQTVTKRLDQYKVGRGKWNLTVQEKLEQTYQAPAALPAIEQTLSPKKMIPLSSLVILRTLRRLFPVVCFTLPLSLVLAVTGKLSVWNNLVLSWVVN